MISQKSSAPPSIPREPKRARGKARVEAILDAAAAVFAERGYDAATMVEIGERAKTAAGSLYRFFPTKELLANALLAWYAELIGQELDAINRDAPNLWPEDLADVLVDVLVGMRAERASAVALVSARGDTASARQVLRTTTRAQIVQILMTTTDGKLSVEKAETMAIMLLHILKGIPGFQAEPPALRDMLIDEARGLARLYLRSGLQGLTG